MDNPFTKTFPVSWHELHRDCKALAWKLVTAGPWKGIIAITRGGLVPAAIVARELDVRLIDTVSIKRTSSSRATMAAGTRPPRVIAMMPFHGPAVTSFQASALQSRCNSCQETGKVLVKGLSMGPQLG